MSPFDTGVPGLIAFIAAVATAVATVTTLLVSIWLRKVDEVRPDWIILDARAHFKATFGYFPQVGKSLDQMKQSWQLPASGISLNFSLLNASQESGTLVTRIRCSGCTFWGWPPRTQSVSPGEMVRVSLSVHPDEWSNAELLIFWRVRSLWRPKTVIKVRSIPIRSLTPRPTLEFWEEHRTENRGTEMLKTGLRPIPGSFKISNEMDLEALPRWAPLHWISIRRLRNRQWCN